MSIYDNVACRMRIHQAKKNRAEYRAAIRHSLEIAGLWEEAHQRLNDPATSLSIGQQQRHCLARGLAVDPISSQNIESNLLELKQEYVTVIVTRKKGEFACLDFRVIMPVKGIITRVEHPCVLLDRLSRVRHNRESWNLTLRRTHLHGC
jgi:ABC-type phosphate transport system ATPase subunit